MQDARRVARRLRTTAVLALGVVAGVMLGATPAGAHFQASISHIWHHIDAHPVDLSAGDTDPVRYFGFSLDVFPENVSAPAWIIASWAYKVPAPGPPGPSGGRTCTGGGSCD